MFLTGDEAAVFVEGGEPQPAGVDLSAAEIYSFAGAGFLGRGDRRLPPYERLEPRQGRWILEPGAYRLVFREVVRVPVDCVGFCYPRSTLLRSGVLLSCAVWDPGYVGRGSALLVVLNPHGFVLEVGARVAQLVYARLTRRPRRLYSGVYMYEGVGGGGGFMEGRRRRGVVGAEEPSDSPDSCRGG